MEADKKIDEVRSIEYEMKRDPERDYKITELGKKVARGFSVRMGQI